MQLSIYRTDSGSRGLGWLRQAGGTAWPSTLIAQPSLNERREVLDEQLRRIDSLAEKGALPEARLENDQLHFTAATEAYGVSRPTYYQTKGSFDRAGIAGLAPQKRGPRPALRA